MAILTLTATQEADVEVKITDARGNPAQVQDPTWESTEAGIVEVVPTADPLKVVLKAVGPTDESSQVKFTADADLGSGVHPIIALLDVVVTAGQAMIVEITAGPPREQGSTPTP